MRLLVRMLWACMGMRAPDDALGPLFLGAAPLAFLQHAPRWSVSHAAARHGGAAAAAAAASAASSSAPVARKLIASLHLRFLLLLTLLQNLLEDVWAFVMTAPRTARVVSWAVRAGVAYKHLRTSHADPASEDYQDQLCATHTQWAKALAAVCRANGGIYVKFGQFATSFGAVPREYRVVLAQLEDKATPRPFKAIKKVLQAELGVRAHPLVGPPGSGALFAEFEENATAAASLAQVHRARLATGEEVAVKLQYPGLWSTVWADLATMKRLARAAKLFFPDFSLAWLYDEMSAKLIVELRFSNEIHNANRMRGVLSDSKHPRACVPHIFEELSTDHMIVMEWIQGIKLTDVPELKAHGINPHAVGIALCKLFAELIFVHGYVHGDPHPGNLMVRPRGRRSLLNRVFKGTRQQFDIVMLDHGTHLEITPELREQFCQLWCSFITGDETVQADMSGALAGKRFRNVLPAMLTQQVNNRMDEVALQRKYGVRGFGDLMQTLALVPRDIMELLRINTVIRASSSQLGIKMGERKRIFAWYARRGMPHAGNVAAHVHPSSRDVLYRARLLLVLSAWQTWTSMNALVHGSWSMVLRVFGFSG